MDNDNVNLLRNYKNSKLENEIEQLMQQLCFWIGTSYITTLTTSALIKLKNPTSNTI